MAKTKTITLAELIQSALRAGGYDGLVNDEECGCSADDIAPCGELRSECVAARNNPNKAEAEGQDFWLEPAEVKK